VTFTDSYDAGDVDVLRLNGSYNFGPAALKGSFGRVKDNNDSDFKANEYEIGVDVPLAANLTLSAGYAHSKGKVSGTTVEKTSGFGAAVAYSLSKRTTAYAGFNSTKTEFKFEGSPEFKTEILAVGVKHAF
jgi:predicted porin